MKYLKVFAVSIMLIPIWGLTFLDIETSNSLSSLIALVFTLYCFHVLKDGLPVNGVKPIFAYMIGPVGYLVLSFVVRPFNSLEFLFSPLLWACVICALFLAFQRLPIRATGIFFIFLCYLYSFHLYPVYKRVNKETAANRILSLKKDSKVKGGIRLQSFRFLNKNDSLIQLPFDNKPILIETWNEKCGPCLKSIDKLEAFISKNTRFHHIYLYQNFGDVNLPPDKVFSFAKIKDKSKILIDPNNSFFRAAGLTSYPYFLFFDRNGSMVDHFVGFHDSLLPSTQEKIIQNSKLLNK